ncbi:hypothetical protein B7755_017110 [Streptomyces sp. NBS 14/10]|uniref:hypothetical protein n=1 Tax=Streptomyces sp. NBS 14/10 TaxID=1945643 RepID=UPI000B7D97B6|nr:hypothetical protein [Streptomyces sp. NBS 14/10]KAK1179711.1 hypothetical protein B7755_017110 [Streptomyces sp. NBS 14/10]
MSSFLAGIGTKLAERWVNALLLPGLLWTALLAAALHLGQTHPFAADRLSTWLNQLATRPAAHAPGTVVLAASASLLAASGVGLLASALGGLVERLWALPADQPPATWLLRLRRRRWDEATRQLKTAIRQAAQPTRHDVAPERAAAQVRVCQRRRARLGPARPVCATRVGDRFGHTATRTAEVNGLDDLALVWPRLWTVLPAELRTDITAARTAYAATARLAAWGLLYTALGAAWWPAAVIGPATLATSVFRARAAANVLADLVETAADLHLHDLAERLAIPATPQTVDAGHAITERLRPRAPLPLVAVPPLPPSPAPRSPSS